MRRSEVSLNSWNLFCSPTRIPGGILAVCVLLTWLQRHPAGMDGPVQPLPPSCSGVPAWAGGAGKIGRFPGIFLHSCSPAADYCCHMSCFTAKPSCLHELRRSLGDRGLRGQTHRPPLPLPPPPQRDTGRQEKRSQGKGGWCHLHGLHSAITGLTQCEGQEGDPRAEPPAVH